MLVVTSHAAYADGLLVGIDPGTYVVVAPHDLADPSTTSGVRSVGQDYRLLQRTTHVCAALNTTFGLRVELPGFDKTAVLPVTIGIDHPVMTNHAGRAQSHDSTLAELHGDTPHFTGWTFADPAKLLPGRWRFTVSHQGVQLLQQDFDVDFNCAALIS